MQVDLSGRGLQVFSPGELLGERDADTVPVHITGLNLSRNSLGSAQGLQGLLHLTVLDLSFNGLTSLSGGLPLHLVSLNVSHNSLSTLQGGALYPLQRLEVLNVSCNLLVDLRGVSSGSGTATLRVLDASNNRITTLNGLERCTGMEELRVECNLIKEAASVASVRQLPRLRELYLKENPVLRRKRQVQALHALLPQTVKQRDIPPPSAVTSVNTSTVSASTAATAVEIEELHRASANSSRESAGMKRAAVSGTAMWQGGVIPSLSEQTSPTRRPSSGPDGRTPRIPNGGSTAEWTHHTGSGPLGTSPLGGSVGGENVSPLCPRRSLPDSPPSVPPLQPYCLPPPGPLSSNGFQQAPSTASPAEARMLRSSLLERVVGGPQASFPQPNAASALVGPAGPRALVADTRASHKSCVNDTSLVSRHSVQVLEDLVKERDAYKRQVEELTQELERTQQVLLMERENTAVVLCINDQLQMRLQRVLSGESPVLKKRRPVTPPPSPPQGGQAAAAAVASIPPLAPPPVPLPVAPSIHGPRNPPHDDDRPRTWEGHKEVDSHEEKCPSHSPTAVSAVNDTQKALQAAPSDPLEEPHHGKGRGGRQAEALLARRKAAALMAKLRPSAATAAES